MTAIADLPDIRPSLLLDFANSGRVDPRIECTRASAATCYGPDGKLRTVAANVPRIDYDPATGKCLGLLVEEARTNLFTYSAPQSNTGWNWTRCTRSSADWSFAGVPATRIVALDAGPYIYKPAFTFAPNTAYCLSGVFKKGTHDRVQLSFSTVNGFDSNHVLVVNLNNGSVISASSDLKYGIALLSEELFYIWISGTTENGGTANFIPIQVAGTTSGDAGKYIDFTALQLEVGSFPTSYIPTDGTAVTRAADFVEMTGANFRNWFKQEEGTFVVSGDVGRPEGRLISVSEGYVVTNQLWLRLNARSHPVAVYTGVSYKTQFSLKSGFPTISEGTLGLAYRSDGAIMSVSGEPPQYSGEAVELSGALDVMVIGAVFNRSNQINGHVRRIAYYSRKLDGVQLQRLTA